LNNLELKKIVDPLLDTFLKAGSLAKEICHRGVKITIKSDNTPVTDGDLAVDKLIRDKISSLTPNLPIVSEETVDITKENLNKNFWLVDPIDGTKEYIRKKSEYTLNAALIINSKPAAGVVYAPEKDRLFFSYGIGNAFEITNKVKTTLDCKKKTELNKIHALSYSKDVPEDILKIHKRYGVSSFIKMSSSLKFCIIAAGEADIYVARARAREWDIAAGHSILISAGGIVTNLQGEEFFYGKKDYKNPALIAKRADKLHI
tara:strand:- start:287 stop:1066 length:780 start_codon:yes stop_codon:yes gene_type:complete